MASQITFQICWLKEMIPLYQIFDQHSIINIRILSNLNVAFPDKLTFPPSQTVKNEVSGCACIYK